LGSSLPLKRKAKLNVFTTEKRSSLFKSFLQLQEDLSFSEILLNNKNSFIVGFAFGLEDAIFVIPAKTFLSYDTNINNSSNNNNRRRIVSLTIYGLQNEPIKYQGLYLKHFIFFITY
jgi:hypothetical protein